MRSGTGNGGGSSGGGPGTSFNSNTRYSSLLRSLSNLQAQYGLDMGLGDIITTVATIILGADTDYTTISASITELQESIEADEAVLDSIRNYTDMEIDEGTGVTTSSALQTKIDAMLEVLNVVRNYTADTSTLHTNVAAGVAGAIANTTSISKIRDYIDTMTDVDTGITTSSVLQTKIDQIMTDVNDLEDLMNEFEEGAELAFTDINTDIGNVLTALNVVKDYTADTSTLHNNVADVIASAASTLTALNTVKDYTADTSTLHTNVSTAITNLANARNYTDTSQLQTNVADVIQSAADTLTALNIVKNYTADTSTLHNNVADVIQSAADTLTALNIVKNYTADTSTLHNNVADVISQVAINTSAITALGGGYTLVNSTKTLTLNSDATLVGNTLVASGFTNSAAGSIGSTELVGWSSLLALINAICPVGTLVTCKNSDNPPSTYGGLISWGIYNPIGAPISNGGYYLKYMSSALGTTTAFQVGAAMSHVHPSGTLVNADSVTTGSGTWTSRPTFYINTTGVATGSAKNVYDDFNAVGGDSTCVLSVAGTGIHTHAVAAQVISGNTATNTDASSVNEVDAIFVVMYERLT